MKRKMNRMFHPAVVVWLLALVGSLAVIAHTHFTADMSAFLPKNPTDQQRTRERAFLELVD